MPFIEVIFNSQDLALSVTSERVNEILELVNIWFLNIKRATVSQLETLFYCSSVHSSCIFIAHLLNWLHSIPEKQSAQPVPSHITKDLV